MNVQKYFHGFFIVVLTIALFIASNLNFAPSVFAAGFSDLDASHWAYPHVTEMVADQVVGGYPDGTFQPDKTINRAEFASILVKAAKIPLKPAAKSIYDDVQEDAWYNPYIESVQQFLPGYKDGNQYFYLPYGAAEREDITVAIMKVLGEEAESNSNQIVQTSFKDYQQISEKSIGYIGKAVSMGIIGGYEDGTFRPNGSVTRAEAATILGKALKTRENGNKPIARIRKDIPTVDTLASRVLMHKQYDDEGKNARFESYGDILDLHVDEDGFVIAVQYEFYSWNNYFSSMKYIYGPDGPYQLDVAIDDKFTYEYKDKNNSMTTSSYKKFKPTGIIRGNTPEQLMIVGQRYNDHILSVHQLKPEFEQLGHVSNEYNDFPYASHFGVQLDAKRMVVGDNSNGNIYLIEEGKESERISRVPSAAKKDRKVRALAKDGDVYTFDNLNKQLMKHNVSTKMQSVIATLDVGNVTAITTLHNRFYFVSDSMIYELNPSGEYKPFLDLTKLRFNQGIYGDNEGVYYKRSELLNMLKPFENIQAMAFTPEGNIIVYDEKQRMLKRINLYEKDEPAEEKQPEVDESKEQNQAVDQEIFRVKRSEITADALALDNIDISDLIVDEQDNIFYIDYELQYRSVNKFIISKYDMAKGNAEPYITDDSKFHVSFFQREKIQDANNQIGRKLIYSNYLKTMYMLSTSQHLGNPMIVHELGDEVETAAFNFEVKSFSDLDFAVITTDKDILYSDIKGDKIYMDRLITSHKEKNGNEFLKGMDFDFSGKKTAALISGNKLYVLDTGSQTLSSINLSTGAITKLNILDTMEQATAVGNGFYFTNASSIFQLSLDGKVELLADLKQIKVNDGIYKPADKNYIPYHALDKVITRVVKIAVDSKGNPVILDRFGVIWKINIFE